MTTAADTQASLESDLKAEIIRMYQEVADHPDGEFHFFHGREAAELFGYAPQWLDRASPGAVASFAGVGNPHERSHLQPGETVLDLGSGAGLDAIVAAWQVGPTGRVIGVDLNPAMCLKAQTHAAATGAAMECHQGRMEDIPVPDASVDVVISNGVMNLSFRKRRVAQEMFRVLRQALGQLNRRRSPGRRDVPAARGDWLYSCPIRGRSAVSVPQGVDAELSRSLRREGRHDDRAEARGGQTARTSNTLAALRTKRPRSRSRSIDVAVAAQDRNQLGARTSLRAKRA